jgi:hypothetical protein
MFADSASTPDAKTGCACAGFGQTHPQAFLDRLL